MATKYGEDIAVLKSEMKNVKDSLNRIEDKLDNSYVTRREFAVAKWIVGVTLTVIGFILGSK